MYASCYEDSDTGKESCACQYGFVGSGVECQGHYLFDSLFCVDLSIYFSSVPSNSLFSLFFVPEPGTSRALKL